MKASIRASYLSAMGVTQWFPRSPLVSAGPSHPLVEATRELDAIDQQKTVTLAPSGLASASTILSDLSNSTVASNPTVVRVPSGDNVPTMADSLSEGSTPSSPSSNLTPNEQQPASVSDSPSVMVSDSSGSAPTDSTVVAPTDTPRFALQIVPLCRHISWVFDAQLDQSLILAFCYRVKQGMGIEDGFQPTVTHFQWPFIESAHQDQSVAVARQALKAQWQFMKEQGCQYVMTWGRDSSDWFKQAEADVVFCYPETELALSASVKSRVWQALAPLL